MPQVEQLEALGLSHDEAVAQAEAEHAAALAAAAAEMDGKRAEREADLASKLKKKLDGDLKDVAHMRANGARILDVGLEAFKQQQHDLLAQKAAEVRGTRSADTYCRTCGPRGGGRRVVV